MSLYADINKLDRWQAKAVMALVRDNILLTEELAKPNSDRAEVTCALNRIKDFELWLNLKAGEE